MKRWCGKNHRLQRVNQVNWVILILSHYERSNHTTPLERSSYMSAAGEIDTSPMLLIQTSSLHYQELCQLNVLGLADSPENNQEMVYTKFRELTRDPAGWYKTGLPWKGNTQIYPTMSRGARDSCDLYWGSWSKPTPPRCIMRLCRNNCSREWYSKPPLIQGAESSTFRTNQWWERILRAPSYE